MKKLSVLGAGILLLALALSFFLRPKAASYELSTGVQEVKVIELEPVPTLPSLKTELESYLKSKKSPLADYVDVILQQKNWKRIVAISSIESSFCRHQLGYNCWGIKGKSGYLVYKDYPSAILDAERVMEKYEGKTYAQMNGIYVQPASANWLSLTTRTDRELSELESGTTSGAR